MQCVDCTSALAFGSFHVACPDVHFCEEVYAGFVVDRRELSSEKNSYAMDAFNELAMKAERAGNCEKTLQNVHSFDVNRGLA